MASQRIQHILRRMRLLTIAEYGRFLISLLRVRARNKAFIAKHPTFRLPPKALAYDAYSAPDWSFYMQSGAGTATYLAGLFQANGSQALGGRVLEWGCGPARVIRHMQTALGPHVQIYGSDYNSKSIAWCRANIPGMTFVLNGLEPPLPFESGFFEFVYSISVVTHLSAAVTQKWMAELWRIMQPGGVLVLTTLGASRRNSMLPDELRTFDKEGFVVREAFEEGKRCFLAIHSPSYARLKLFARFEVLRHNPADFPYTAQDCWLLRKPRSVVWAATAQSE